MTAGGTQPTAQAPPLVSPDGYWRWDGQVWVPNHPAPTSWGTPPAAPRSRNGKTIAIVVGSVVSGAALLFFVVPMLVGLLLVHSMSHDIGNELQNAFVAPPGPITDQLRSAGTAQQKYEAQHGVYASSIAPLQQFGFEGQDGIDVAVLWVQGDNLCMAGSDGSTTYYLSSYDMGQITVAPCVEP